MTWNLVEGRITPPPTVATLESDTILVLSTYYHYSNGSISVDPNPNELDAPWTLNGPANLFIEGNGDTVMAEMVIGNYSLVWRPVDQFETPPPEILRLMADNSLTFTAEFIRSNGTISIDPLPGHLDAPWTLNGPGDHTLSGVGDTLLANMDIGDYTIIWGEFTGRVTPDPETALHSDDSILVFSADYPLTIGSISIDPNPDILNASWTLFSPSGLTIVGDGDSVLTDMDIGMYSLVWGEVDDYLIPAPGVSELQEDDVLAFSTDYVFENGTISVNPNPDDLDAPWTLTGPGDFTASGVGDSIFTLMVPGDYTVVWGDIFGLVTPPQETAALEAEDLLILTSRYTFLTGTIQIDPEPDTLDITWTLSGPANLFISGTGDSTLTDMDAGNYSLVWGAVPDYVVPPAEVLALSGGAEQVFESLYTHQVGSISITPIIAANVNDLAAPWVLTDTGDYSLSGEGDATLASVETGEYTLTWGTLDGYQTPPPETLSLGMGGIIDYRSEYIPNFWISDVVGLVGDGLSVTLNGIGFGQKANPAPLKWDRFDIGTDGELLTNTQPEWVPYSENGARYSSALSHSGGMALRHTTDENEFATNYFSLPFSDEVFISYWWRTNEVEHDDLDYGVIKLCRITSSSDAGGGGRYNGDGSTGVSNMAPRAGSSPFLFYEPGAGMGLINFGYVRSPYNEWFRMDMYKKLSTAGVADGHIFAEALGQNDREESAELMTRAAGETFQLDTVLLGLMVANDQGYFEIFLDDIYIDNTQARVELGNNPQFHSCSHREMQLPTAWNEAGDQITITINRGTFAAGSRAWLFVVDSDGTPSPGYEVILDAP